MLVRLRFIAFSALAVMGATRVEAQPKPNWIAFETIDQSALPIVRVWLNGTGAHRLVLDVGIPDVILDTTVVDGSGLKLVNHGELATIDYYGKKEKVPVSLLDELKVGGLTFQKVRTLLVYGEDGTGSGGLRSYGRIGRDVLEHLRLTVNYPRHLLYIEPSPGEVPEGGVTYKTAGHFLLIPVILAREGGDERADLVLDTNTSETLLDRKWAAEKGFAPKKATSTKIPRIQIGSFSGREVPVQLGSMKELPYGGQAIGVIGADMLLSLSVTYDFARDLIWFVSVKENPS